MGILTKGGGDIHQEKACTDAPGKCRVRRTASVEGRVCQPGNAEDPWEPPRAAESKARSRESLRALRGHGLAHTSVLDFQLPEPERTNLCRFTAQIVARVTAAPGNEYQGSRKGSDKR